LLKEGLEEKQKLVDKSSFQLLSFFKGFQYLSSQDTLNGKIRIIQDMYQELFQPAKIFPYYKKTWSHVLWPFPESSFYPPLFVKVFSCWDTYILKKKTEYEAFLDDFGNAESLLMILKEESRVPSMVTVLRSSEGEVLAMLLFSEFRLKDMEFLKMLNALSGLSIHDYFNRSEIKKLENTYERVMKTFQKVNELYFEVKKSMGIVDFYTSMKENLVRLFDIIEFYLLFEYPPKVILLPDSIDESIQKKIMLHLQDNNDDIVIDYLPERDSILYSIPANYKEKRVLIGIESRDEEKMDFLIQLLRLGFKDLLARIIFD
jgi:hypothetical protein